MIKIYGMSTCPDCVAVDQQAQNDPRFEIIDLGSHVLHLKAFLKLRDTHPAFDAVKRHGGIGIPCFVKEDGTVTLDPREVGLLTPEHDAPACNLDGSGC
jgi:hypothetical protein